GMHIHYFLYNILCYRRYFCLFTRPPETSFIQPFSKKQISARQALTLFCHPSQFGEWKQHYMLIEQKHYSL
ncbi:hypothetical protein M2996_27070, partial [Klebsiella pneumoniae]|uniref:hypothetical protein n=1 Tax=Klebsiella pneumoniae TaxID=573 RepID=UPI0020103842